MLPVRRILLAATFSAYFIAHTECQIASDCSVPILYHPRSDEIDSDDDSDSDFGNCSTQVVGSFTKISASIWYSSSSKSPNSSSLELDFLEAFRDQTNRSECLDFLLGYRVDMQDRNAVLNITVSCGGKVRLQIEGFFFKPDAAVTVSFDGGRYYLPDHCFPLAGYRIELDVENERLRFMRNASSELASLKLEGRKVIAAQSVNYKSCNCSRLRAYARALLSCRQDRFDKKAEEFYKKTDKIQLKSSVQLFATIISSGVAISVVVFVVFNKFIKVIEPPNLHQHYID